MPLPQPRAAPAVRLGVQIGGCIITRTNAPFTSQSVGGTPYGALVRWRRKAAAVKQMADRSQTPFVKRGLMQVMATYKALAKRAARRKRAQLRSPFAGD